LRIFHSKYMADATLDISPLALSILELLDERPMHPYELAATMRARHHDEFIRLNFGTLYHTVDTLERDGWIVPLEREKEGKRPERTVYELTPTGRGLLLRVVSDLLGQPKREYPHFAAGLMFMHHRDAAKAVEHLNERWHSLDTHVEKLKQIMAELRDNGVSRLSLIELEHKIAMLESESRWVRGLGREITEGKLEWEVGIEAGRDRLRRRHVPTAN
jgi:DNA-binding PadR family transcriptional regulator